MSEASLEQDIQDLINLRDQTLSNIQSTLTLIGTIQSEIQAAQAALTPSSSNIPDTEVHGPTGGQSVGRGRLLTQQSSILGEQNRFLAEQRRLLDGYYKDLESINKQLQQLRPYQITTRGW